MQLLGLMVVALACFQAKEHQFKAEVKLPRTRMVDPRLVKELLKYEDWKDGLRFDSGGRVTNLRIGYIMNSGTGSRLVVVRGDGSELCGAVNCITWMFRRYRYGYVRILDAGAIQGIFVLESSHMGRHNIETRMSGGAYDSDVTIYWFDGQVYRPKKCFSESYEYSDRNGNVRVRKRPRQTLRRCGDDL